MKYVVAAMALALCACSNPEIVEVSPNTYLITRADYSFGSTGRGMKVEVIQEANDFAGSKGKVVIPISTKEEPGGPGRFATIEYQFRLVDKDHPDAKESTPLKALPDYVVEENKNIDADVRTDDVTEKSTDVYSELIKLEDLRQRGILTDGEFQAQKQKLLDQN